MSNETDTEMLALTSIEKSGDSRWDTVLNEAYNTVWDQDGARVVKYPIDLKVLLEARVMSPFHGRCLEFKKTAAIGSGYETGNPEAVRAMLPDRDLHALVSDVLQFANGYLERETNVMGRLIRLHHVRANSLWRKPKGGWTQKVVDDDTAKITWHDIPENKIAHLFDYSPLSDHYGVPDYLPALLQVVLAYEADDFHRKFYANGAHAGLVILLKGIRSLSADQRKEIETKFKETKGPGHFRSIFMAFNGTEVELEIIGVAKESPVRDDYPEITKSTREKIISAHGVPPRLMSIILDAKSGAMAGQVDEELRLFNLAWVEPFQLRLESFLNPSLPAPIKFRPFLLSRSDAEDDQGQEVPADAGDEEDEV